MIIAENGESESYGVEDGGLFVEMVVTSDFPKKKNQTIVRFGIILRKMDIYIHNSKVGGNGTFIAYLSATCRI